MSFFIRNKSRKKFDEKRKKLPYKKYGQKEDPKNKKRKVQNADLDENISSDSDFVDEEVGNRIQHVPSDDEEETAQEKRLRLAKEYLEEIEREEKERIECDEVNQDVIADRLKEEVLEQMGRLQKKVAEELIEPNIDDALIFHGHKASVTCVTVSPDCKFVYSGSKDCTIIKWSIEEKKKVKMIPRCPRNNHELKGHVDKILCLSVSSDNKFLASGCVTSVIHIWDPVTLNHIHTFKGHREPVTGLAFRKNTHQLFSSSIDRSVKIWNLDEMAYVETLFGHQDSITSVDSLIRDRALSSGGRDNSVRMWKVVEESQLIFKGHTGTIECVRFINENYFVTCGDDGNLSVWGILKKKPLVTIPCAHGVNNNNGEPNWIISVCTLHNTNLIASGSVDGFIKLWKCSDNFRNLTELYSIPANGHVNSLQFSDDGSFLVAGIGQDHRLGRWSCIKKVKNSIIILPLKFNSQS